ncbi:MAG: peptidoglycan editing factor PgeF [Balneolaceae bacterium]
MSSKLDFIRPKNLNEARILSWFTYKNPDYFAQDSKIPGLNIGFNSDESQGVLLHNINVLSQEIGTKISDIALAEQIHGSHIELISKGGVYPNTDGFVSNKPGMALAIQVADCGAVLFGDSKNKVIGAAHAGWRGAVDKIVPKTIEKMLELGADIKHIQVFVSPCIAIHNFEVGDEVASQFPDELVDRKSYSKPHLNLKGLIQLQLQKLGIPSRNINIDSRCTIDHENLFYSYRREKKKSGRMVAVIKLSKLK